MSLEFSHNDWQTLKGLRQTFLAEANERKKDYWTTPQLLALYDQTFAQRIGWKWNSVVAELLTKQDPRFAAPAIVVDYGCGSGIASRRWLHHHPGTASDFFLFDRSSSAMEFAKKRLLEVNPQLSVTCLKTNADIPPKGLVLVSHVVNELPAPEWESLQKVLANANAFVWVEPGTKMVSELMVKERESLRTDFDFVAPCPHPGPCGLQDLKNAAHWCHHFAKPPGEIFRDAFWKKFSDTLKIDLRSLPVTYLVAAKKRGHGALPIVSNRVIGRARVYKGYAKALVCDETGVEERRILSRHFAKTIKRLEEEHFCESLDRNEWEE